MHKIQHNVETGEIFQIELSAEEIAHANKMDLEFSKREAQIAEKQQAKNALLEKIGITEEEAKLLLS